ncbi:class F sortase [Streptomyces sp. NBC_00704]|uniref:class F sortase n=1 Tax=Streptomyces sp. NBC_00704 TaxID=2975809 RepID=UPI002E31DB4B|nr:class F sortase [Streptomyces sp. NBC_00704]
MSPLSRRAPALAALAALLLCGCTAQSDGPAATSGTAAATATDATAAAGAAGSPAPAARAARPLARSAPVGLRIPAIGVDTPLMRLGLAADRSVQVPPVERHDRAGWYEHSPTPGRTGPSVILGHVTVGRYGDGVFRRLDRLHRGDRIAVRLENGTTAAFAVTRVRTVDKASFPTGEVYGNVGRPELRLITCGGPRTGDGYRDNVIVFAALVPGAASGASSGASSGPGAAAGDASSTAGER